MATGANGKGHRVGLYESALVTAASGLGVTGVALSVDSGLARLPKAIGAFSELVLLVLLTGAVAAAVIETGKALTTIRGVIQRDSLSSFLHTPDFPLPTDTVTVVEDLLGLDALTPEQKLRYYNVQLEQLGAQLAEATERALSAPIRNRDFLIAIGGPKAEIDALLVARDFAWLSGDTKAEKANASLLQTLQIAPGRRQRSVRQTEQMLADRSADLRATIEARLDLYQLVAGTRWQRGVRMTASAVSATFAGVVAGLAGTATALVAGTIALGFVVGGPVSWLARDVVRMVQRRLT